MLVMPWGICGGCPLPEGWNATGGGGKGMLGIGKEELGPCGEGLCLALLCCLLAGYSALSISANRSFNPVNLSSGPGCGDPPGWGLLSRFMVPPPRGLAEYGPGCPLFGGFWYDMMPISWLLGTGIWLGNGVGVLVSGYGHTQKDK